jgi:hypothetical protein
MLGQTGPAYTQPNQGGNQGGGFASGIGDLLAALELSKSNYTNPADAGMPYLNQIGSTVSPYYQPYINAGQGALNTLMGQYGSLIGGPGGFLNSIGKDFQQSPGYNFQVNQATNAANRAAAAGGMAGSPMEQQNLASTVNGLANQDYYNWLNNATGLYKTGLTGMSGINQMGFNASGDLATDLANMLMSQANMAYAGQANQNQAQQGQQGGIWGLLGSAAGNMLPGIGSFLSGL